MPKSLNVSITFDGGDTGSVSAQALADLRKAAAAVLAQSGGGTLHLASSELTEADLQNVTGGAGGSAVATPADEMDRW